MVIEYNTEYITRIIEDIYILTDISISLLDTNYNLIATCRNRQKYCDTLHSIEKERLNCVRCDRKILDKCRSSKKLEHHICRSGLYDSAMPLIKDDTIAGFLIMGQVRSEGSPCSPKHLPATDAYTSEKLSQLYKDIPVISKNHLKALYDLLPHILFDTAIKLVHDSFVCEISDYIDANLQKKLSINHLCSKFFVSKNRLYEIFENNLGNTVTGYINERRIHRAKLLLSETNEPIFKIAEAVGIYNYTYFCKLFKKLCAVTPTQYRMMK